MFKEAILKENQVNVLCICKISLQGELCLDRSIGCKLEKFCFCRVYSIQWPAPIQWG